MSFHFILSMDQYRTAGASNSAVYIGWGSRLSLLEPESKVYPQKLLPRGREALRLVYCTFTDVSSLAVLRDMESDDWLTDSTLLIEGDSVARHLSRSISDWFFQGFSPVFHHCVIIDLTEL